ncbi:MAG: hypothetical protein A3G23_06730 [Bacteroidetes bacterium RIFCSPLOWO2_12_FULL_37_12]|nr:MAG: hypothetical protein A3G23_06730 [Bacteroidetes bacterium RIFCSPLOWO2_12_FULL_37_12]
MENTINFRFPKKEHLTGKINIERLLKEGKINKIYPLRIIYLFLEQNTTEPKASVLISVPKAKFPSATQRNLIKRRIREAYRLHKNLILKAIPQNKMLHLGLIYISSKFSKFSEIGDKIRMFSELIRFDV